MRSEPGAPLTPHQRRVAELAPTMSSKAIARALHLSPETVRSHLRACYRKLGIHRREDLPNALIAHDVAQELAA